jgi:hypothetical protein
MYSKAARDWAVSVGNPQISALIETWISEAERRKQQSGKASQ